MSRVDGDVDGEVEQVEGDLGEVEGGQLVVLANFLREFCGVNSENFENKIISFLIIWRNLNTLNSTIDSVSGNPVNNWRNPG